MVAVHCLRGRLVLLTHRHSAMNQYFVTQLQVLQSYGKMYRKQKWAHQPECHCMSVVEPLLLSCRGGARLSIADDRTCVWCVCPCPCQVHPHPHSLRSCTRMHNGNLVTTRRSCGGGGDGDDGVMSMAIMMSR